MKFIAGAVAFFIGVVSLSVHAADPKPLKTYGDWQGQCAVPPNKKVEMCSIFQAKVVKQGDKVAPILVAAVGKQNKQTVLSLRFPHGVLLPHKYTIKVDAGKAVKGEYLYCDLKGCYGQINLDSKWISSLKKGNSALVEFLGRGNKKIAVTVSLKGFTAGLRSIK